MRAKDCVCQTLATMTKDPAACESVALHQFNKACVGNNYTCYQGWE